MIANKKQDKDQPNQRTIVEMVEKLIYIFIGNTYLKYTNTHQIVTMLIFFLTIFHIEFEACYFFVDFM